MLWQLFVLISGFLLLIKGADFFVTGSVSLSKKLKIPTIIIGLTVVAFGTSAPELFVSFTSALKGLGDITLGNVIGSNLTNMMLILGSAALIFPLRTTSKIVSREIPFMLLSGLALWFVADDIFFSNQSESLISRGDSLVLLLLFIIFLYYLISEAIKSRNEKNLQKEYEELEGIKETRNKSLITFLIITGIIMLSLGGKLVIDSSVYLASLFGLSEALVGLTIIAIGSSLPELVTTLIAVKKQEPNVAIGNIVGSNIFNTVLIVGFSGAIFPLKFDSILRTDIMIMLFASIIIFAAIVKDKKLCRLEGSLLLLLYISYLIFIVIRG